MRINKLTVEHLSSGCITDNEHPAFSFSLKSEKEGCRLEEACISVNGWELHTREQIGIVYDGAPLKPYQTYTVVLDVKDNYGETASARTTFETGKFDDGWQGEWISDPDYHFKEKKVSPLPMTFRRRICPGKKAVSAKLYSTALGIYDVWLNGRKVGSDYFAPGFTSYKNQLQYQVYDITAMMTEENELTAIVAGGWAVGAFNYKRVNRYYAKRQAFLAEIRIIYEDGSEEVIGTDTDWDVTMDGNYKLAEFYDGEIYDATVDSRKNRWNAAVIEDVKISPQLKASYGSMVRAHEVMKPVSVTRSADGMLIYDFGQNFAGVITAQMKASQGQKIVFSHAEILMDGELFTEPLRTAKCQIQYTARDGIQEYSPRFTYMGFRYVGVTGIAEEDLELSALALYSDFEEAGSFECSDERLNRLQENIRWGGKSNFMDIPTDCPQRDERMGWTGDIAIFGSTAVYNFDIQRFLEKWLLDVKAEQKKTGGIPVTVPNVIVPGQWEIMIPMAVAYWGDCCILVPWAMYQGYGNKAILKEMYPVMKKYLGAVKFWAGSGPLPGIPAVGKNRRVWRWLHQYGDWVAPDTKMWGWMGRGKWTATACWANSTALMAEIADILGEEEDRDYYRKLSGEIAQSYSEVLMDGHGNLKKEFQTAYVLPLYYHLLEGEAKETAASNLVRMIRESDYRIGTGFPGTPYILFALADNGYEEDAYRLLMSENCPSWLFEVKAGATTVWERWDALREDGTCNTGADDGTNGMVSFNHYAFGAVGDFLYKRVAGIEPLTGGYQTFRIRPVPGGGLTHAKASVHTPYGPAVSEWKIKDEKFIITCQVPVGTSCELILPDQTRELESGCYTFAVPADIMQ